MLNRIETERLYLRPADNGTDLEEYLHHLSDADEWLFQYAEEYSEDLYGMIDFTSHLVFCYAVCLRQTGQMIGYVGLMPELMDASANLEFYFFKEHRRQGFATEAIRAFIAQFRSGALFGFNGKTVIAEVVCENDPSKKLIEKLGFTKTAVGCRMRGTDGVWFVRYELPAPENEQEGQTI